jgi:hypothetical protein
VDEWKFSRLRVVNIIAPLLWTYILNFRMLMYTTYEFMSTVKALFDWDDGKVKRIENVGRIEKNCAFHHVFGWDDEKEE